MLLFDTHAHLVSEKFDEDRAALIEALPAEQVALALNIACSLEEAGLARALHEKYPYLPFSAGFHPHDAGDVTQESLDGLKAFLQSAPACALGEIGLDYHYDFSPRQKQRDVFDAQLSMAAELGLPVILHDREAHRDMLDILGAHKKGLRGAMHCFSGSLETAGLCMRLGLYISFSGSVTFSNAQRLREVARQIPPNRLLIETDCPYLAPQPVRGRRNQPAYVRHTAQTLAELHGVSVDDLARVTLENGKALFGISYL